MSHQKDEAAIRLLSLMDDDEVTGDLYEAVARTIWLLLRPAEREVVCQLLDKGPVEDGDIVSKSARDQMLAWGLAVRCCYRGHPGFTAAAYRAYTVRKAGTA